MPRIAKTSKLTRSFAWGEFWQDDGAVEPPLWTVEHYRHLCRTLLQPARDALGPIVVVSGYRSKRYNAAVGGASASRHVPDSERGAVAADVYCPGRSPRELHQVLDQLGAGGLGLYSTHVHVDTRRTPARWTG